MSRTIIDIHAIQTVPPANLNRDDTGSPKTAIFGGQRRARVSSQSWKRAIRLDFRATVDAADLGRRTKQIVKIVSDRVCELEPELKDRARDLIVKAFNDGGIKVKLRNKDDDFEESGYLVFLANHQIENLAAAVVEAARSGEGFDKKALKRILKDENSIDVALFGRMIADAAALNVDAACQVAHAISVHPVETEFDYYTAVDDEKDKQEETGAGMIGTVEFNSSTLYRYATLDVDRLRENLGEDDTATIRAATAFLRSFVTSMPSGKMNTFANRTLPEAVLVTVRDTQAINLVGAYELPIKEFESRIEEACRRLAAQLGDIADAYDETPVKVWSVCVGDRTKSLAEVGEETNLNGLLEGVSNLIGERIGES